MAMSINVGDLVRNKFSNKAPRSDPWPHGLGLVVDIEEMGGCLGAWVEWVGKVDFKPVGLYWSPAEQLEVISDDEKK